MTHTCFVCDSKVHCKKDCPQKSGIKLEFTISLKSCSPDVITGAGLVGTSILLPYYSLQVEFPIFESPSQRKTIVQNTVNGTTQLVTRSNTPSQTLWDGSREGGGGSWGSGSPPPLWGTPKFHKEGGGGHHANTARLGLNSYPDPPPPLLFFIRPCNLTLLNPRPV